MVHFLKVCQNQPSAIQPAAKFCNICSTKVLDARIFSYAILPPLRLTKSNYASNDRSLTTLTPEHHSDQPCSAMILIEQSSELKFWQCLPNCKVKYKALIEVTDLLMFTNLLTTERSEVVPFFRAVRTKKRGREATPPPGGVKPPHQGREATLTSGLEIRRFSG